MHQLHFNVFLSIQYDCHIFDITFDLVFLVNSLYLPTLNKLTCLYFCQIVLTHIQTDLLHMQSGRRAFYHVHNQYFFQKQTHIWSVVTDQSLYFRSVVSKGHVEILLRHCFLADVVEISTQTCLLYVCCLSYAVSPRLVLCR